MPDTPGLEIMNLALLHLGEDPITQTQLNEMSTVASREIMRAWVLCLKETLRGFDWGFARVEEALEETTYEPVKFEYSYSKPDGCLAIRRIFNESTKDDETEKFMEMLDKDNGVVVIVTDCNDAYIRYTNYVTDVDLWDSYFVTTFSHRLAAEIAMPITGDKKMAETEINIFNTMLSEAHRNSSIENTENTNTDKKSSYREARS